MRIVSLVLLLLAAGLLFASAGFLAANVAEDGSEEIGQAVVADGANKTISDASALPAKAPEYSYIKPSLVAKKQVSKIKLKSGSIALVKKEAKSAKAEGWRQEEGCSFVDAPYSFVAGSQNSVSIICYFFDAQVPCPEDLAVSAERGSATLAGENELYEIVSYAAPALAGNDTITATTANYSCAAFVNATPGGLAYVLLAPQDPVVIAGGAIYFVASAHDAYGNLLEVPIVFAVDNPLVGFISQDGIFSAYEQGQANVSASVAGALYNSTIVTVVEGGSYCRFIPPSAQVEAGEIAGFEVECYHDGGPSACNLTGFESDVGAVENVAEHENGTSVGVEFRAQNQTGQGTLQAAQGDYVCNALVEVIPSYAVLLNITPEAVALDINQSQQFAATGTDAYGNTLDLTTIADWSVVGSSGWSGNGSGGGGGGNGGGTPTCNGTISNGFFTATGYGSCYVVAAYGNVSGNASVLVNMLHGEAVQRGAGGNGGAPTGGAVLGFGALVQKECAGKPIAVTVMAWGEPVEGANVRVTRMAETGTIAVGAGSTTRDGKFVAQTSEPGDYVVGISIGTTESQEGFTLYPCSGAQLEGAGAPQGAQVKLEESAGQIVLQRTVTYQGGVSRKFEVVALPSASGQTEYRTKVTVIFKNAGKEDASGRLRETVPAELVSDRSLVSYGNYPDAIIPGMPITFDWRVDGLISGREISYTYEFARPITDAMIDKYAAPEFKSMLKEEISAEVGLVRGIPFASAAAAAIGNFAKGDNLLLLGVIAAGAIFLFAVYRMGFAGGKKE